MKRKKAVIIFAALSALIIGILLVADSAGTAETIKRCIYICLDSLIPSLFCFMAFSSLLIKSGIGEIMFTPLWYIMKFVLHLDRKMFGIFMLSQIGGYPIGVKLLSEFTDGSKECDKRCNTALCYCYNSGPAFVIGIVGINRSPCCGVNTTSDDNRELEGQGVFITKLKAALTDINLEIPVIGVKADADAAMRVEALL